ERDAVIASIDAGDDGLGFSDSKAQPVHAGVDMNSSAAAPARAPAEYVPFGELVEIADHGPAVDAGVSFARVLKVAVEYIDRGRFRHGAANNFRLIERCDEEGLATGVGESPRHLLGAAAIGV